MYGLIGEKIWIDDERPAPDGYRWCRTYDQAIATIEYFDSCENGIDEICFDHDLSGEKTGYDIAKYIVEKHIAIGSYHVHSMNPVGRKNIIALMTHYGYNYRTPQYIQEREKNYGHSSKINF